MQYGNNESLSGSQLVYSLVIHIILCYNLVYRRSIKGDRFYMLRRTIRLNQVSADRPSSLEETLHL